MNNTIGIVIIVLIVLAMIATAIYLIKAYKTEYKGNGFFSSVIDFILAEDFHYVHSPENILPTFSLFEQSFFTIQLSN